MLIAFELGTIVLWDLRGKCAELRWQSSEPLRSIAWHHEGKYFVSSHTDGSLCTWPLRPTPKPQNLSYPHGSYFFCDNNYFYLTQFHVLHFGFDIIIVKLRISMDKLSEFHTNNMFSTIFLFVAAKTNKDGKLETCKPIHKVDLKTTKMG